MRNINEEWKDDQEIIKQNTLLLSQASVQSLFNGYYYDHTVHLEQAAAMGGKTTHKDPVASAHPSTSDSTKMK